MYNQGDRPLTGLCQSGPVFLGFRANTNRSRSRLAPGVLNNRTGPDFQTLEKCETRIKVGANGGKNLVHHQAGKGCCENLRKTKERKAQEKTSANALKFFSFGAPKVPATVTQPARVHGMASSNTQSPFHSPSKLTSLSPPTQNLRHPTAPHSNISCLTSLYTHIQTIQQLFLRPVLITHLPSLLAI